MTASVPRRGKRVAGDTRAILKAKLCPEMKTQDIHRRYGYMDVLRTPSLIPNLSKVTNYYSRCKTLEAIYYAYNSLVVYTVHKHLRNNKYGLRELMFGSSRTEYGFNLDYRHKNDFNSYKLFIDRTSCVDLL